MLAVAQIAEYRDRGFVILREFFPQEFVSALAAEADALVGREELKDKRNLRCRWQTDEKTGACVFETFDPVIDLGPQCRAAAENPRLFAALADLYGGPAKLFKDKLIFKPPGAKGYVLHQDWIAWDRFPRSFLTVLLAIDASTEENGCTIAYAGLHKHGALAPEDGMFHPLPPEAVAGAERVPLALAPGDVAIFDGFTPHESAPNRSDGWRRQLYLSYNAERDGGDLRSVHYEDFHQFLREKYAEHGQHDVYFR